MYVPIDIPLCFYEDALGRHRLRAMLDELSLTYRVVAHDPDGRMRELRSHIPSLAEARRWAIAFSDEQARSSTAR
jgi:hypothetical protein